MTFGPSSINSPDINIRVKGGHLDLSLPERLFRVFDLSIFHTLCLDWQFNPQMLYSDPADGDKRSIWIQSKSSGGVATGAGTKNDRLG